MMVGRPVETKVKKSEARVGNTVLEVKNLTVISEHNKQKPSVNNVSFSVSSGEIVSIAGIDGNGQSELIYALTGLIKAKSGTIKILGEDMTNSTVRYRNEFGIAHIPEDRHKHGLILDFTLENNCVLLSYFKDEFQKNGFIKKENIRRYAETVIDKYDVRSGEGAVTITRTMSGGNQQKAIIGRELDRDKALIIAVQPTRGLDVGAIENIHSSLVKERDKGKAVLLVSLELDEVMNLSDRIFVIHEGSLVGEFLPEKTTVAELGLYMAGVKEKKNEE
jgi:simple sugar transport system ATP-binding protein